MSKMRDKNSDDIDQLRRRILKTPVLASVMSGTLISSVVNEVGGQETDIVFESDFENKATGSAPNKWHEDDRYSEFETFEIQSDGAANTDKKLRTTGGSPFEQGGTNNKFGSVTYSDAIDEPVSKVEWYWKKKNRIDEIGGYGEDTTHGPGMAFWNDDRDGFCGVGLGTNSSGDHPLAVRIGDDVFPNKITEDEFHKFTVEFDFEEERFTVLFEEEELGTYPFFNSAERLHRIRIHVGGWGINEDSEIDEVIARVSEQGGSPEGATIPEDDPTESAGSTTEDAETETTRTSQEATTPEDVDSTDRSVEEESDAERTDTPGDTPAENNATLGERGILRIGGGGFIALLGGYALLRRTDDESSKSSQQTEAQSSPAENTEKKESGASESTSIEVIDKRLENIEKRKKDIERAQRVGAYDHAIDLCDEITDTLVEIQDSTNWDDSPTLESEIESQLENIRKSKQTIEERKKSHQSTNRSIEILSNELDEAADILDQNNPKQTLTLLSEIAGELDDIETTIQDQDFADLEQRLVSCREWHKALKERAQRAREAEVMATISDQIDEADALVAEAQDARAVNEYDSAVESSQQAVEMFEEILDTARAETPDRVAGIKIQLEESEQLLAEIKTEAEVYRRAKAEIETVSNDLDTAANALDEDEYDMALRQLRGTSSALGEIEELIMDHDFGELTDQVEQIQESYRALRKRAYRVPKTVPTAPSLSLEYDDISKKESIGVGGNADVYRATVEAAENETIALKEPRVSGTLHTEAVRRLLNEAETWQRLDDHDYIVGIVDYDSDPLPWIAMEYMDAGHLGSRAGETTLEQGLWIAIATTEAVRHAHRQGIAHLDLKPENILFRSVADAWDIPKVADWGLSEELLRHSKSIEGLSPHYAAPEQFNDSYGSTDDITDVYQLGSVFYELLTGQPPFDGNPARVMNQVLNEDPLAPSEVADVPDRLDDILLTALATDRDDRYESVLYFRDQLQQLFDTL